MLSATAMNGTSILINIVGSVALLLWGVRMVRTGVIRAFGAQFRRALGACTRNRLAAFGSGVAVTTVLQSSTATALMLSSFATRNLIALPVALAAMLGADVGSTLAAQVFSFNLGWLSPAAITVGVVAFMAGRDEGTKGLGRAVIGFGLMLLALGLLAAAAAPLRASSTFAMVLGALGGEPLLAVLVAALATWLAHSSLSIVLLVMSLAASGAVPLPLALALVLGANLGGAAVPLVMQSAAPAAARRIPLGNLAMRAVGIMLALPVLAYVLPWLMLVDPMPARAVINFHTAFNLALAALFLPFLGLVARLNLKVMPDAPAVEDPGRPRYLDPDCIDSPSEALACAARETLNLGDQVARMLRLTMEALERNDPKLVRQIEQADNAVDKLYESIKLYLIQSSRTEKSLEDSRRSVDILTFTTNLEHIGDIIDKNLMELATKRAKGRLRFSDQGWAEISALHQHVLGNLQLALTVFVSDDPVVARRLLAEKVEVRRLEREAYEGHLERLKAGMVESIETSALHLDVLRDLKRIHSHIVAVAYPILERTGELASSRLLAAPADGHRARAMDEPDARPAADPS